MHTTTVFLARLIGLYCALLGAGMLVNRRASLAAIETTVRSPPWLLMSGIVALPVGLALVLVHSRWSDGALAFVVSLFGWAVLVKAVSLIALPQESMLRFYRTLNYDRWFVPWMAAVAAVGLVLALAGFAG